MVSLRNAVYSGVFCSGALYFLVSGKLAAGGHGEQTIMEKKMTLSAWEGRTKLY